MPYSFVEIEKQKTWLIKLVFTFLVIFYFVVAEILWLVTKAFAFYEYRFFSSSIFSIKETILVFIVAILIAAVHWYFSTGNMIERLIVLLGATEPDPNDTYHQTFKNIVEEVCVATGGRRIRAYVVPTSGLNAFAISDFNNNAIIGVTEGLLAKLTRSQLEAVVGHEAAHAASGDSLLTTISCSLFGMYAAALEGIARTFDQDVYVYNGRPGGGGGGRRLSLYLGVIYIVLAVTQFISTLLNMFLSRQQEYRADAVAVRLTRDPIAFAEALYTVSRSWRGVGEIPNALAPLFLMNPEYSELEESEGLISDIFSTHPPTTKRLALLVDMAHTSIEAMKEMIPKKAKIPADAGVVDLTHGPQDGWMLYKDNAWQGPFSIDQLMGFKLSPNSWVSKTGDHAVKRAFEDTALNQALRDKIPGVPADAGAMMCPECHQPLNEAVYEGAPVFRCHYCGGLLTSNDVVLRILLRDDFSFSPEIQKMSEDAYNSYIRTPDRNHLKVVYQLSCPKCTMKMRRSFFTYGYPVEVDRCDRCQLIWFAKNELEAIQSLFEKFKRERTQEID